MSVAYDELEEGDFVEFRCQQCNSPHFHVRGVATTDGIRVEEIHCCSCDLTVNSDDEGMTAH
jgi:hypothetical protein